MDLFATLLGMASDVFVTTRGAYHLSLASAVVPLHPAHHARATFADDSNRVAFPVAGNPEITMTGPYFQY